MSQLGIQKFHIKRRIVNDQRVGADKFQKPLGNIGEFRLVGQKRIANAVHGFGFGRHGALGINIDVKGFAAGQAVDEFQTPNLDNAVAL